jgi:Sulfotransferase family
VRGGVSDQPTAVKVLYIAGSGRTGSTVLSAILGQLDGFFSVGELINLWERGLIARRRCGCGIPVDRCPTWTATLAMGFDGRAGELGAADAAPHGNDSVGVDPVRMLALQRRHVRARYLPRVVAARRRGRSIGAEQYRQSLQRLYRAVQQHSGCRVMVDSSKAPIYGATLEAIPGIDLYVVHLVRDPRATAYSWLRRKRLPDFGDDRLMQRLSPLRSAVLWLLWQVTTELFWARTPGRYLRLRYEDLVGDPVGAVLRILELVGEAPSRLPFTSPTTVWLAPTHSVSGNPNRFETGAIELAPDDAWIHAMRHADRLLVTAIAWPLLLRYRYRLRSAPQPRTAAVTP